MKFSRTLGILAACAAMGLANAQDWSQVFAPEPSPNDANDVLRWVEDYQTFHVEPGTFDRLLANAPKEIPGISHLRGVQIVLPRPDGKAERFMVWENSLMGPQVQRQVPWFRTFSGQGIDDPHAILRMEYGNGRLTAMVLGDRGNYYIEPLHRTPNGTVFTYWDTSSIQRPDWICNVTCDHKHVPFWVPPAATPTTRASGTALYTFRLAVNGTVEYTAARGGIATAPAAVATSVNRVDGIYRRDLAIGFNLVWVRTWEVEPDGFTNSSNSTMLGENATVLNNLATGPGVNAYDLGHVFSTTGGGVAFLASVGGPNKAGAASGLSTPVGDAFDMIVAHEIGHQFDGYHAFNATGGGCASNRMWQGAFEPGAGASIMSYAGRCPGEITESDLRPYFNAGTISRMLAFRNTFTNVAGIVTPFTNSLPVITVGPNRTIPRGTPFRLEMSAVDADNDPMTYSWEQIDLPASSSSIHAGPITTTTTNTSRPLFRSFLPSSTGNIRFFPSQSLVLSNNYTNAFEFLPNVNRTMRFRATVRDNRTPVGGVNERDVVLTVSGDPFVVTSPTTAVTWNSNQRQTVTWTVGGGSVAPNVRILLSTNGGNSYFTGTATVLLASTPNDGSQEVVLPAVATTQARIFVEAVDNYFFEKSNSNFTIQTTNRAPVVTNPGTITIPEETPWSFTPTVSHPDDLQTLTWSLVGTPPAGLTVNPATGQLNWTPTEAQGAGSYSIQLRATDNGSPVASDTETFTINVTETPKLLTGTVQLDSLQPDEAGRVIQLILQPVVGGLPTTVNATLGAAGAVSADVQVPVGQYRVLADAPQYLRRFMGTVNITTSGAAIGAVILPAGDVNNDGEVDLSDIDAIIADYLSSNSATDVDGSGEVDLTDIDIAIANYLLADQD